MNVASVVATCDIDCDFVSFFSGVIRLSAAGFTSQHYREHSLLLEQYAFSNAIASSVKLGMLEARSVLVYSNDLNTAHRVSGNILFPDT